MGHCTISLLWEFTRYDKKKYVIAGTLIRYNESRKPSGIRRLHQKSTIRKRSG